MDFVIGDFVRRVYWGGGLCLGDYDLMNMSGGDYVQGLYLGAGDYV